MVVPVNLGDGRVFNLRLPRFLPAQSENGGVRRSYEDTCGLYDIVHARNAPAGFGPQPHLHYVRRGRRRVCGGGGGHGALRGRRHSARAPSGASILHPLNRPQQSLHCICNTA